MYRIYKNHIFAIKCCRPYLEVVRHLNSSQQTLLTATFYEKVYTCQTTSSLWTYNIFLSFYLIPTCIEGGYGTSNTVYRHLSSYNFFYKIQYAVTKGAGRKAFL